MSKKVIPDFILQSILQIISTSYSSLYSDQTKLLKKTDILKTQTLKKINIFIDRLVYHKHNIIPENRLTQIPEYLLQTVNQILRCQLKKQISLQLKNWWRLMFIHAIFHQFLSQTYQNKTISCYPSNILQSKQKHKIFLLEQLQTIYQFYENIKDKSIQQLIKIKQKQISQNDQKNQQQIVECGSKNNIMTKSLNRIKSSINLGIFNKINFFKQIKKYKNKKITNFNKYSNQNPQNQIPTQRILKLTILEYTEYLRSIVMNYQQFQQNQYQNTKKNESKQSYKQYIWKIIDLLKKSHIIMKGFDILWRHQKNSNQYIYSQLTCTTLNLIIEETQNIYSQVKWYFAGKLIEIQHKYQRIKHLEEINIFRYEEELQILIHGQNYGQFVILENQLAQIRNFILLILNGSKYKIFEDHCFSIFEFDIYQRARQIAQLANQQTRISNQKIKSQSYYMTQSSQIIENKSNEYIFLHHKQEQVLKINPFKPKQSRFKSIQRYEINQYNQYSEETTVQNTVENSFTTSHLETTFIL